MRPRFLRTSYLTVVHHFDTTPQAAMLANLRASLIRPAKSPTLRRLFCSSSCTSSDVCNPPLQAAPKARRISCKSVAALTAPGKAPHPHSQPCTHSRERKCGQFGRCSGCFLLHACQHHVIASYARTEYGQNMLHSEAA